MVKLLAVAGDFEALTVPLTIKLGVVLSCDFGYPFLRCRKQSNVCAELIPRVYVEDLWSGAWVRLLRYWIPSSATVMIRDACWLLLEA